MPSFADSVMPADCMALQSTRPSAVKCMTKFGYHHFSEGYFWMVLTEIVYVLVNILLKCVARSLTEN